MSENKTKLSFKDGLSHFLWLVGFFLLFIPSLVSAQQVFGTDDNIIYIEKGTTVVGLQNNKTLKEDLYLVGNTQFVGAKQVLSGKIVKIKSKVFTPKSTNPKVANQVKQQISLTNNPTVEVIKAPVSSSEFTPSTLLNSIAVLVNVLLLQVVFQNQQIFLLLFFFFVCLFFGHRKSHIFQPFLKTPRVRPPPFICKFFPR
jgi:hypothetical protein